MKLSRGAIETLKIHRKRQNEERLSLGTLWQDTGLVFTTMIGTPMDGDNLAKRSFVPLLERAGLSKIRFHDLRHTVATVLLSRGPTPRWLKRCWVTRISLRLWIPILTCCQICRAKLYLLWIVPCFNGLASGWHQKGDGDPRPLSSFPRFPCKSGDFVSALGRTRTCDLLIRSPIIEA